MSRYMAKLRMNPVRYRAFRDRENARKRRYRAIPGWRAAHEPEVVRKADPIPPLHTGHPLFERACAAVQAKVEPGRALCFPYEIDQEDARSEYVMAVLERGDPELAVSRFLSRQRDWRSFTVGLDAIS
jgi:hypothetical protein